MKNCGIYKNVVKKNMAKKGTTSTTTQLIHNFFWIFWDYYYKDYNSQLTPF